MLNHQSQELIDHLDNSLRGTGSPEMELLINEDSGAAEEWYHLRQAVEAIQYTGLYEQVGEAKSIWLEQRTVQQFPAATEKQTGGVVRSITRNLIRAAACILILSGGATLYKYTTTNPSGFY